MCVIQVYWICIDADGSYETKTVVLRHIRIWSLQTI
jgi:hypothetical protein